MPIPEPLPLPRRRAVLTLATASLTGALLTACGPVRLGQPSSYTPPPVGIDDLYRADLVPAIGRLRAAAASLTDASPEVTGQLRELSTALLAQLEALRTGAEAAASDGTTGASTSGASASDGGGAVPTDLPGLLALLTDTARLGADAAVQCSGSLARVTCGIGTYLLWTAVRLTVLAQDPSLTAPAAPAATDLTPGRTVPASDPPSVAATVDYQTELQATQADEWFAGYADEVRAARATAEPDRAALLATSTEHRDRARMLAGFAAEDAVTSVVQEPVYPLPDAGSYEALAALAPETSHALVVDWVALTGAAPFSRRAATVSTALAEAVRLAGGTGTLEALPSLSGKKG